MKVAVVVDRLSRYAGGLFCSVRRLCQETHRRGIEVHVFGSAGTAASQDLPLWQPLPVTALSRLGPETLGYLPGLLKVLKDQQPSVIQLHGLWKYASLAVLRASGAIKCPRVIHPHGMLDPWAVRQSKWKKLLAGWAYEQQNLQGAACLRALNHAEARAIRAFGLRVPVCIIPNAIDVLPHAKCADTADLTAAQESLAKRLATGHRVMLFLGRIHPKKGLSHLLEAWAQVQKTTQSAHDWVLAIAGWDEGAHERELQRQATALNLARDVVFLGPLFGQEKASYLGRCDAVVLPSLSEGLPMSVLEAWAHAKPVLMTSACNLPEGFAASAAVPIDPSPESIAAGIRTICEMTPSERAAMGQRGLELVQERYTWPEVARQMCEVYAWILGGGPVPGCVERI